MVVWSGFEEARRQQPMTWTAVKPDILCREAVQRAIACIRLCALYSRVGELRIPHPLLVQMPGIDSLLGRPFSSYTVELVSLWLAGSFETRLRFSLSPTPPPLPLHGVVCLVCKLAFVSACSAYPKHGIFLCGAFLKLKRAHIATVRTSEVRNWTFVLGPEKCGGPEKTLEPLSRYWLLNLYRLYSTILNAQVKHNNIAGLKHGSIPPAQRIGRPGEAISGSVRVRCRIFLRESASPIGTARLVAGSLSASDVYPPQHLKYVQVLSTGIHCSRILVETFIGK